MKSIPTKTMEERFWEKVDKSSASGCWFWTAGKNPSGYGVFYLSKERQAIKAHRVSYEIEFGRIPKGKLCCHKCDNPSCVRPSHLFLGTDADNMRDMAQKGRNRYAVRRGVKNPKAKLDPEKVREIRRLYGTMPIVSMAEKFNVSWPTIYHAAIRKTWKHVE